MAPAAHVFAIPEGVDDGTALALLVQGTTAWHLYRTRREGSRRRQGRERRSVALPRPGGVGSLAVQLGHSLGAGRVIATASSEEKRELALRLGADAAIDPAPEGLTERLMEANGGRPVDVVFEMAGGEVFDASYRALAPFGRIVVCGIASQQPNEVLDADRCCATRARWWASTCSTAWSAPACSSEALADLFARVAPNPPAELEVVVGTHLSLGAGRRRRTSTCASGAPRASCCSIPPLEIRNP